MKILIVGCGSIGRRHAQNAQTLGADVALCDINEERMHNFGMSRGITEYYTDFYNAAEASGVQAAVIATPTSLHVEPALAMIDAGISVLMEKPLCILMEDAWRIERHARKQDITFMMAHTFRFRDEWAEVLRMVQENPLGKIYSAEFNGGWYLPDWHIHEDYRHEYAASKALGGGVMLTGMSHIIDIVRWFFGNIEFVTGAKMRQSDLDMDVDDFVTCSLKMKNGTVVTIIEDFLCRFPRRQLRMNAEHGYLEADFNCKIIRIWDARKKRFHPDHPTAKKTCQRHFRILEDGIAYDPDPEILSLRYSGNDAYLKEMGFFLDLVKNSTTRFDLDIESGIKVLEIINHPSLQEW